MRWHRARVVVWVGWWIWRCRGREVPSRRRSRRARVPPVLASRRACVRPRSPGAEYGAHLPLARHSATPRASPFRPAGGHVVVLLGHHRMGRRDTTETHRRLHKKKAGAAIMNAARGEVTPARAHHGAWADHVTVSRPRPRARRRRQPAAEPPGNRDEGNTTSIRGRPRRNEARASFRGSIKALRRHKPLTCTASCLRRAGGPQRARRRPLMPSQAAQCLRRPPPPPQQQPAPRPAAPPAARAPARRARSSAQRRPQPGTATGKEQSGVKTGAKRRQKRVMKLTCVITAAGAPPSSGPGGRRGAAGGGSDEAAAAVCSAASGAARGMAGEPGGSGASATTRRGCRCSNSAAVQAAARSAGTPPASPPPAAASTAPPGAEKRWHTPASRGEGCSAPPARLASGSTSEPHSCVAERALRVSGLWICAPHAATRRASAPGTWCSSALATGPKAST